MTISCRERTGRSASIASFAANMVLRCNRVLRRSRVFTAAAFNATLWSHRLREGSEEEVAPT